LSRACGIYGTVFALDLNTGTEKVLHSFAGGTDGATPEAGLIEVEGTLYGTTNQGGAGTNRTYYDGCGTVFALDPGSGMVNVLYPFCSQQNCVDGELPAASLIDVNGCSHDFDFALGRFHTHIRRLLDPLAGSNRWVTCDGTKTDRPLLDGTGSVETIEADGPDHLELMTLRLYGAAAHQWSLNFSSSGSGQITTPAIGEFENGVGTFLDQENYNGRTILVRQIWSKITPVSYHFEQAFSADFGKTWQPNFIADLTREGN